jgi:dephospho-CoA kinase
VLRVGLTGGIACGKSHVLEQLARAGLHVLDLDRVAHRLMAAGGAANQDVARAFGTEVLAADGGVDRKALGAIVFSDAGARARLGAIVHPRVRQEEARFAASFADEPAAVVVTDAALLVEAGVHLRFDRLVVVHCAEDEQLRRLMARDGLTEPAARARIAAQMPVTEKRRFAHFLVDTAGALGETARAAEELAGELQRLAAAPRSPALVAVDAALGSLAHGPASGPRGLHPGALIHECVAAGGIELPGLAALLEPPAPGPWYRAAEPGQDGPGPEALAAPLALWAVSRGSDDEALAAAAASLARLTHLAPEAVAGACLAALAVGAWLRSGGAPADPESLLEQQLARAQGWGGAPAPGFVREAVMPAARAGRDVSAARAEAKHRGGSADLAGTLSGIGAGARPEQVPLRLLSDVLALLGR